MVKFILSAIWQAILGCFGISAEQKLGRAEEVNKEQAETIQDVRTENEVHQEVSNMSDSDKRKLLSKHWSE